MELISYVPLIPGDRLNKDSKPTGRHVLVPITDVLKVTSLEIVNGWNKRTALLHTKSGLVASFIPTMEIVEELYEQHGIMNLDISNLVNMNNILELDKKFKMAIMGYGVEATISKKNVKLVETFLKNKKESAGIIDVR